MNFTDLYDRYFGKVYNYVHYHVRVPDEADDVTGRIFEAALKAYGAYDAAKGPLQAWLFTIARNAGEPHPSAALERKEEAGLLLAATGALDERSRDIIALKFSSGMNNREIAQLTGLGESNVGILVYRAVKKMQEFIEARKL